MTEFPFQISIRCSGNEKQTESVTCKAILRTIAGSRDVYDASWNGKNVIVKVFSDKLRARRHLKREWWGLNLLKQRDRNSPQPFFTGRTEDHRWAIVSEKIENALTVSEVFEKTQDKAARLNLLIKVCRELAKQHEKGILQKDLHLGNFLIADDKVFALDAGQMRFYPNEIGRKKSTAQLALLAGRLSDEDSEGVQKLYQVYTEARGWRFDKAGAVLFEKQRLRQKKLSVEKWLKKTLRTSRRTLRIETNRYVAVFDKGFCNGAEPVDFIKQLDELMAQGQILKNGNTCYVSRTSWNGKDVVVKRYNHKGLLHSLCHTIKRSRARRCWLHAHRLIGLNIATPRPLAYLEQRRFGLVWKSYLITEFVEGLKLDEFLSETSTCSEKKQKTIQRVRKLFEQLAKNCIRHGDLKSANIIISNDGPVLIDLDGMKAHRLGWIYKIRQGKDLSKIEEICR